MQEADPSRRCPRAAGITGRAVAAVAVLLASLVAVVGAEPPGASAQVQPDHILTSGETLRPGEEIHSPNGRYRLVMQASDSNLVLYDRNTPLWATYTVGSGGARLVVQHDSNVVVYRGNTPLWHTVTHGQAGPVSLVVQDDGNLVLYGPYGAIWNTGTSGAPAGYSDDRFVKYNTINLPAIGACARIKWTGSVSSVYSRNNRTERWDDITLRNPEVEVTTYVLRGNSCTSTRKTVGKMRITQRWSGYNCSFNPGIGVSFPWGVSVEPWVDCGEEKQAIRTTTYFSNTSRYRQSNSGAPVDFGSENNARRDPAPCFGTVVDITAWNITESASDTNNTTKIKVCL
ncbi:MAG: hypothetical protein AAGA93_22200 [Actinomycetota bacterium]